MSAWEGPLFVVGMPRSGTKLLRSLLNQHPRIRIPEVETEFLPLLVRWVERNGPPVGEQQFEALAQRLAETTYFEYRAAEGKPFSWRDWRAACHGQFDTGSLFEGFVRSELGAHRGSGVIWGDKSPAYVRNVDLLLRHFPDARVIHLVRDVRDQCVSMRKAWNQDIRRAAWRWGTYVMQAHRHCLAAPSRCIEVKYEDLIRAPEQSMRRLCTFLDLPFDPALAQLQRSVENLGDATGRAQIVGTNSRKYTAVLSRAELHAVESLAWDTMHAMGYAPEQAREQRRLNAVSRTLRKLRDGWHLVVHDVAKRGLARSLRFHHNHQRTISR